jgi:hypothetical protein
MCGTASTRNRTTGERRWFCGSSEQGRVVFAAVRMRFPWDADLFGAHAAESKPRHV